MEDNLHLWCIWCMFLTATTFFFQLMLDTWNESIFSNIKSRLQDSAMKLVHAERLGEAFDSQLVIGVRESYGKTDKNKPMVGHRSTEMVILFLMCAETNWHKQKLRRKSDFKTVQFIKRMWDGFGKWITPHALCSSPPLVNLCSNPEDKLQIYRDNFEKAYLDSTERFYRTQAPSYLQQNGVQNYMKYVCHSNIITSKWLLGYQVTTMVTFKCGKLCH